VERNLAVAVPLSKRGALSLAL